MTVGELRLMLIGIPSDAVVSVGVTYTWDGKSGDALMSHDVETGWDGPDFGKPKATSFSIHGEVPWDDVVKAGS